MATSPRLHLTEGSAPAHERLAEAIRQAIASGAYRAGDRLPTHREIARQAEVSIGTVTRAIESLSQHGVIRGEVGRGTFVTAALSPNVSSLIDLTINAPPSVISERDFAHVTARATRQTMSLPSGGYLDLRGTPSQRAVMADWLTRTRVETTPDDILLCVGAQQALHLAFADLKVLSPVIVTEGASFAGAISAARNLGMSLAAVDHDAEGMRPDALEQVLKKTGARAVYLTPVCQNPLGFEIPPQRRRDLMAVCVRHDAFIIEDDIYSLYAQWPDETFRALAPDRVYYLTSLSKCLTPLVRTGILVPPTHRYEALTQRLRAEVWGMSPLALEIGCEFIRSGVVNATIAQLREEAKARVSTSAALLKLKDLPMPGGAPHIWLPMPALQAERLARRASEHNVRVTPPDATHVGGTKADGVRLCIMAPQDRSTLEQALKLLAGLIDTSEQMVI